MSETDEEDNNGPKSKEPTFMDLDLDLDSSWPLIDQNPFSPFPTFSDQQPCSPLWAFSDDERMVGNVFSTVSGGGGLRLSDYPRFLSLNVDPKNEPLKESNDNKRLPSIHIGLAPLESDGSCVIKERITQALRYFKESTEQHVLAQVWAPVKNGGRCVLTTSGQPFVLDPHNSGLNQYRMVSVMYMFSVDEESDGGDQGLPGRVFQHKLPEWTPNVQYYSSREFSRLDHAHNYNVQGTLALPVFEPSGQSCVAVIELIMTSQKIHYAPEVDKVCKALEAVNLKSSEILEQPKTQICNKGRHNALAEILEIITVVCETYKLPLAQTWVPCRHRSVLAYGGGVKKSCSSFDGSCMGQICMSTSDVAFYVVDAHIWGFREACAEHHLQAGQGVSGRAFSSHNTCFCSDITKFSKTEYPLVHYARLFGLTSCFAICLRSTHTGNDDYVLEFFLPPSMKDVSEQQTLLDTLMDTMKQHFQSLKIASKEELEDEKSIKIIKGSVDEKIDSGFETIRISESAKSPDKLLPNGGGMQYHKTLEKQLTVELDVLNDRNNAVCSDKKQKKKTSVKKRGKAEKSISLDVLQQYFAGSLKDAAKSLGVCPTTMKRICRQHGISRWPSRKINKVSRSLSKLKRVIESVSWPAGNNGSNPQISPTHNKSPEAHHDNIGSPISKTPKTPESNERTKTRSGSREETAGSPTSRGSCKRSPANENTSHILSHQEHLNRIENSVTMAHQLNISTHNPFPDAQESFGAMLVEDCGSSKDLQNLCPEFNWTNPKFPEFSPKQPIPISTDTRANFGARPEMTTVTIKATYREDIIRFKIPLNCSILELREEIAKRLKLEVGTFDIKYIDDDREWVLIACDADLQECMDVSSSSGGNMIRLSISDVMASLGSSCESNG